MYHPFSVVETFNIAWKVLKKNFATIAVFSLLAFVIIIGAGFVIYDILADSLLTSIGVVFLLVGISFIFLAFIKLIRNTTISTLVISYPPLKCCSVTSFF